jgi:hypothetical protein
LKEENKAGTESLYNPKKTAKTSPAQRAEGKAIVGNGGHGSGLPISNAVGSKLHKCPLFFIHIASITDASKRLLVRP